MVKTRLKTWPQRPPGIAARPQDAWLRGRPTEGAFHCFLKLPGSDRLRTLPDGLWLNFGGTPAEPFVDIFAIEACATHSNLLDKRSRFSPSTNSLMAVCPVAWLMTKATPADPLPRWRATGVLLAAPVIDLVLPVRGWRVLFGLRSDHYDGFIKHQLAHAHELYAPMEALTAEHGDQDQAFAGADQPRVAIQQFPGTETGGLTQIYVDADACPVREEVYRVAMRAGLGVLVVHNGSRPIRPPEQGPGASPVQIVIVPDGPDAADNWIAERITPGDICVTADIPLAKRCLERGARALGNTGRPWTGDNIGPAMAGRDIARHMRETGAGGGGHAPLGKADRSRFLTALDAMVSAVKQDILRASLKAPP